MIDRPDKARLRVGIVGLWGHEAYALQVADHPSVDMVGIASYPGMDEAVGQRLDRFSAERHVARFAEADSLLEQVDALVAMTAPRCAASIVVAALEKNLHVLAEKPFAHCDDDVVRLRKALARTIACFTTCLPIPTHAPVFRAARAAIGRGDIGQVLAASFTYLASMGPRYIATEPHFRTDGKAACGGECAMFGPYGVAALEWLTGRRVETVMPRTGTYFYEPYRRMQMEDLASVTLHLEGNVFALMTVGRTPSQSAPTVIAFDVTGTAGRLAYDSRTDAGCITVFGADGPAVSGMAHPFDSVGYDFVEAVLTNRPTALDAPSALSTMEVLAAVYRSASEGRPAAVDRG